VLSILSRWLIQFCLYLSLTSCIPEISSYFRMTSFLVLSSLVYPVTLLRKRISAASRRVMSLFVVTHVSLPYRWLSFDINEQDSMKCKVKVYTFHHLQHFQTGAGAHQISHLMGTKGSFLGAKRPKRDVIHFPPSGARLRMGNADPPPVCRTTSSTIWLYRVGRANFTLFATNCVLICVQGSSPWLG